MSVNLNDFAHISYNSNGLKFLSFTGDAREILIHAGICKYVAASRIYPFLIKLYYYQHFYTKIGIHKQYYKLLIF